MSNILYHHKTMQKTTQPWKTRFHQNAKSKILTTLILMLTSLFFTGILCSCVTKTYSSADLVFFEDKHPLGILPSSAMGQKIEILQLIEGHHGDQTYYLQAMVDSDQSGLSINAFTSMGNRAYDLYYAYDGKIEFGSAIPLGSLNPAYLIFDFQLLYYPAQTLNDLLHSHGYTVQSQKKYGIEYRQIFFGTLLICELELGPQLKKLENKLRGYGYTIRESQVNE